jgi:hypothetical protein
MYVLSTGCQWRYIPKDLPPRSTVNGYYPWEFPRLCRGGSRSLTFAGVVVGCPPTKLWIVSRQSTRTWSCIDGRAGEPKSHQVGVQIPRCFHSQVPPEDAVCAIASVSWRGLRKLAAQKESRIEEVI